MKRDPESVADGGREDDAEFTEGTLGMKQQKSHLMSKINMIIYSNFSDSNIPSNITQQVILGEAKHSDLRDV